MTDLLAPPSEARGGYTKSLPKLPGQDFGNFAAFLQLITNPYISAKKRDIFTKLSGYDRGGPPSSFMMS